LRPSLKEGVSIRVVRKKYLRLSAGNTLKPHQLADEAEEVGEKPTDTHLASRIVCVDDEIIAWLERRERRRCDCSPQVDKGTFNADLLGIDLLLLGL
jgi:hypothetical protein